MIGCTLDSGDLGAHRPAAAPDVAHNVQKCIAHLLDTNHPHNLVITHREVYLFPRKPAVHAPGGIIPGFPEMSGNIIIPDTGVFDTIRPVLAMLSCACSTLSGQQFTYSHFHT